MLLSIDRLKKLASQVFSLFIQLYIYYISGNWASGFGKTNLDLICYNFFKKQPSLQQFGVTQIIFYSIQLEEYQYCLHYLSNIFSPLKRFFRDVQSILVWKKFKSRPLFLCLKHLQNPFVLIIIFIAKFSNSKTYPKTYQGFFFFLN